MGTRQFELICNLAHELAVSLELAYEPVELREVWGEAVEYLREARDLMVTNQAEVPETISTVIKLAEEG